MNESNIAVYLYTVCSNESFILLGEMKQKAVKGYSIRLVNFFPWMKIITSVLNCTVNGLQKSCFLHAEFSPTSFILVPKLYGTALGNWPYRSYHAHLGSHTSVNMCLYMYIQTNILGCDVLNAYHIAQNVWHKIKPCDWELYLDFAKCSALIKSFARQPLLPLN